MSRRRFVSVRLRHGTLHSFAESRPKRRFNGIWCSLLQAIGYGVLTGPRPA
jgi:hypothetical protein